MALSINHAPKKFPALRLAGLALILAITSCRNEKDAARELIETRRLEVNAGTLADALREGDLEVAKAMIILEVDPNAQGSDGEAPLILASKGSASPLVPLVLENGADMAAVDESGKTALAHAVENGNLDAVV